MEALGGLYLVVVLLMAFVGVLWILMPFAIFGTKDKLETLIIETKRNTEALEAMHETLKTQITAKRL